MADNLPCNPVGLAVKGWPQQSGRGKDRQVPMPARCRPWGDRPTRNGH